MENNLEYALITGGLLGLIIIPFLAITHLSKRRKTNLVMTARMADLAHRSNCQLSLSEQFGATAIGLDENARTILFIDTNKNKDIIIDLAEITACKLLKKMDVNTVGSIELQLINRNRTLSYTVPFYRRFIDDDIYLPIFIKTAEKWRCLIHGLVSNQRESSAVRSFRQIAHQTSFSGHATQ